jgi:hypothetical protein
MANPTVIEYNTTTTPSDYSVYGVNWAAQTFTLGTTGVNGDYILNSVLLQIKLMAGSPTGNVTASIRHVDSSGNPVGQDLVTSNIAASSFSGTQVYQFNFGNIQLSASTKYAIVLRLTAGDGSNYIAWQSKNTSVYAGGNECYSANSGASWGTLGHDMYFQVLGFLYSGTMCSLSDALAKGGASLPRFEDGDIINSYVRQAESFINVATRYNWIDNYTGLNVDVKYFLSQVVSDQVGIYLINYSMGSYGSRTEAEDMINVLRDSMLRNISILREQLNKDFVNGA